MKGVLTVTCAVCNAEVASGPNEKSVLEAAERHKAKKHPKGKK